MFSQNKTIFKKMLHVHSLASVEKYMCNGKIPVDTQTKNVRTKTFIKGRSYLVQIGNTERRPNRNVL